MISKILCWLNLHDWLFVKKLNPNRDTNYSARYDCSRCGDTRLL